MEAAEAAGITDRTARRWLKRWREEGSAGLLDRSSAPRRIPHKTPPDRASAICALRQLRLTAAEISEQLQMPLSTITGVTSPVCELVTSASSEWPSRSWVWARASSIALTASRVVWVAVTGPAKTSLVA